jgi:hypothetical protein
LYFANAIPSALTMLHFNLFGFHLPDLDNVQ